jgi:hypothetical protein
VSAAFVDLPADLLQLVFRRALEERADGGEQDETTFAAAIQRAYATANRLRRVARCVPTLEAPPRSLFRVRSSRTEELARALPLLTQASPTTPGIWVERSPLEPTTNVCVRAAVRLPEGSTPSALRMRHHLERYAAFALACGLLDACTDVSLECVPFHASCVLVVQGHLTRMAQALRPGRRFEYNTSDAFATNDQLLLSVLIGAGLPACERFVVDLRLLSESQSLSSVEPLFSLGASPARRLPSALPRCEHATLVFERGGHHLRTAQLEQFVRALLRAPRIERISVRCTDGAPHGGWLRALRASGEARDVVIEFD